MGHTENRADVASMAPAQKGVVVGIQGGCGATQRLDAMGIRPGVALTKLAGHPFGGPIVVRAGTARIALGFGMAKKIIVEIEAQQEKP